MVQQGQVFKLKTKGVDGKPLWAYRYRLQGRNSGRRQVGGFATRTEAQRALPGSSTSTCRRIPGLPVTVSKLLVRAVVGPGRLASGAELPPPSGPGEVEVRRPLRLRWFRDDQRALARGECHDDAVAVRHAQLRPVLLRVSERRARLPELGDVPIPTADVFATLGN
jgi:hypothetical protein